MCMNVCEERKAAIVGSSVLTDLLLRGVVGHGACIGERRPQPVYSMFSSFLCHGGFQSPQGVCRSQSFLQGTPQHHGHLYSSELTMQIFI